MKYQVGIAFICSLPFNLTFADEKTDQHITQANQHQFTEASLNNFSGKARFARYPVMPSQGDVAPAIVNFEAGTITHWHIHPEGQYLMVIDGEGQTQEWGKPIQTIRKGDVVWCPPHVKHWHGASQHSPMSHIAITPVSKAGKSVTWLEPVTQLTSPVSDPVKSNIILSEKQLYLVPIAVFTTQGQLEKLKLALTQALNHGLSINQIKEVFSHQAAYIGFPRALNGLLTFKNLLEDRQKQGDQDLDGVLPSTLPRNTDYYSLGVKQLTQLNHKTLTENTEPLFNNFSPTMDYALKAYLFGYLFSQDNLSALERELIVVSVLSSMGHVDSQLRSHWMILKNLGLKPTQTRKIINRLKENIDGELLYNTQYILQEIEK